ncbi:putative disease resistance protein At3g14460 isoform X2 [Arachis stenosperma]|uniref:putative disease resistance protein At3g14460 isoform X2 n=1 Tax=Arachis stenosperma TaxID=217475 RepID=UPI0025AD937C|nr:putative disease resistance protein At3g14460 isoform X2 [Arachis stenosperma]
MAAKLEGGAYLSSFVDAVLEKLSPILEDDDFVLEENDSALELLGRLERSLYDVGSVLDDAELKQFSDKKVKKWLVDLQDALYKADDLLDELSTKAATATQRDPDQLQHKSLRELYVEACDSLKLLPLGDFPNLKKLMISKCQSMECVVVPQALPSLQYLSISECPSLVSLPALTLTVPQLEELHICDCPEINCFAEEFLPPSLKTLEVTKCQKLASWITSKGLQSEGLTHLWLGPCFDVKSFPREGCLPASLQALKLSNFPNLETLDCKGLHHLTSLKSLAITDCEKLENITEEHLLPSIEHIYIGEDCPLRWKLARRDGRPMV